MWVGGGVEGVVFHIYLSKSTGGVYKHNVFFYPLVQNPSKMSVKERLGFSTKPAAPIEKVRFYSLLTVTDFLLEFLSFQISQMIFVMTFIFLYRCFRRLLASQRLCTILLH